MFRKSRLPVALTPERANELLSRLISASGDDSNAFLGTWKETRFEVRRVNSYKSSYLPLTRGRVVNSPGGTELELSFRPHRQVLVFFSIWLTFLLLASGLIVVSSFTHGAQRLLFLSAPFGLAAFTLVLGYRVFRSDCGWVEEALKERLEKGI